MATLLSLQDLDGSLYLVVQAPTGAEGAAPRSHGQKLPGTGRVIPVAKS
jgi:hypothetical protein